MKSSDLEESGNLGQPCILQLILSVLTISAGNVGNERFT